MQTYQQTQVKIGTNPSTNSSEDRHKKQVDVDRYRELLGEDRHRWRTTGKSTLIEDHVSLGERERDQIWSDFFFEI